MHALGFSVQLIFVQRRPITKRAVRLKQIEYTGHWTSWGTKMHFNFLIDVFQSKIAKILNSNLRLRPHDTTINCIKMDHQWWDHLDFGGRGRLLFLLRIFVAKKLVNLINTSTHSTIRGCLHKYTLLGWQSYTRFLKELESVVRMLFS